MPRKVLSCSILIGCGVYLCLLGKNILLILGWASTMPFLVLVACLFSFRVKEYYTHLILFIIVLIGFIVLNHCISHVVEVKAGLNADMYTQWLVVASVLPLYAPFIGMIELLCHRACASSKKVDKIVRSFNFLWAYSVIIALVAFMPFAFITRDLMTSILLSFTPFPLGSVIMFTILARMRNGELAYLLKPLVRIPGLRKKQEIIASTLVCIFLLSLGLEYFRGFWLFAGLCCLLSVMVVSDLFLVYKHISDLNPPKQWNDKFHLPLIWDKRVAILTYTLTIVYFIIWSLIWTG